MTPLEKLASLPKASTFLKEGVSLEVLKIKAKERTDLQAAAAMQKARRQLFAQFSKKAA